MEGEPPPDDPALVKPPVGLMCALRGIKPPKRNPQLPAGKLEYALKLQNSPQTCKASAVTWKSLHRGDCFHATFGSVSLCPELRVDI